MCAAGCCPHKRQSWHVEKRYVKILRDLRENFEPDGILGSRSGYCDLKGFQVDLSAAMSSSPVYMFLDRKIIRLCLENPLLAVGMKI